MTKKDYELIAESIWRCGFIPDNNKIREKAREKRERSTLIKRVAESELLVLK